MMMMMLVYSTLNTNLVVCESSSVVNREVMNMKSAIGRERSEQSSKSSALETSPYYLVSL